MAERHRAWRWGVRAVAVLALGGCGKSADPGEALAPSAATANPATDRLGQPFEVATTLRAPEGSNPPPQTTASGKQTATFPGLVQHAWPTIKLTDADGKPSPIVVTLDTDAGPVEITLFPDAAPNHVRNFLALAQVGFYDGLAFDRIIRQNFVLVSDGGKEEPQRLEMLVAGCPAGDGDPAHGHLGYFLHFESSTLKHEEGTVGLVLTGEPDSGSCRFYVCLAPAPLLDGNATPFGKVTRGMDVIHAIAGRPVKDPTNYPESEQPREPVRIKSVRRQ